MVVKVYVSGISGNKEVKKRQQRVQLILDSRNIKYEVIDIAEPDNEAQKDFMQNNSTSSGGTISDPNPRHPLPPQLFNDDVYCGDYDQFDLANEVDEMEKFLKLAPDDTAPTLTSNAEIKLGNGEVNDNAEQNDNTATKDEQNEMKNGKATEEADNDNKVENGDEVKTDGDVVDGDKAGDAPAAEADEETKTDE